MLQSKEECLDKIRKLEKRRFMLTRVEKVTADVIVAEKLKKWIIENRLKPGGGRLLPTFSMRLQIFDLASRISALRTSQK